MTEPATEHLSRAAMVVVRFDGPAIVRHVAAPPYEPAAAMRFDLELGDLRWLARARGAALSDVVEGSGDGAPAPRPELVQALADFSLIEDGPPHAAGAPAAAPPRLGVAPPAGAELQLAIPTVCSIGTNTFDLFGHDGQLAASLSPVELAVACSFCSPRTTEDSFIEQSSRLGAEALDAEHHRDLVAFLFGSGLVREHSSGRVSTNKEEEGLRIGILATMRLRANTAALLDELKAEPAGQPGVGPAKVFGVQVAGNVPPLSTGMVMASVQAAALEHPEIARSFDLRPHWIIDPDDAIATEHPSIYLFTNYIWSHEQNLDFSRALKERHPNAITIHGGPDCPTYPRDTEIYLRNNPQVDIMVRGEGEQTAAELFKALAPTITSSGGPDLSVLRDVPGLAFQLDGEIVRTDDRERITDVGATPSPFLSGIFDVFAETGDITLAIIETNRGCPYGCTFCDWGSSTNSRIRKFDIERVYAEFEWCARNRVERVFLADANFGIFSRDVDIAHHMVGLKEKYGYPKRLMTNYAKNTVKHLREIVEILAKGDVLSEGLLSLQTMDDATLSTIRRSNIKLEKYEALAKEFHEAEMPLFVDLMLGLPGQTVESFRNDLQQCVDREVNAKVHTTELLVNSPMNNPAYRDEHQVVTTRAPGPTGKGTAAAALLGPSLVVSTSTFTREDYRDMDLMRRSYLLLENLGVMRHVSRFVRREMGTPEVELMETVRHLVTRDRGRWPMLEATVLAVPNHLVPPVSWAFYIDELREVLVGQVGVAAGSALETVLAVQHAVLPAPGRDLPLKIELAHDYPAWYGSVMKAKDDGHLHDWETVVGRLEDLGPTTFEVDDPHDVASRSMGIGTSLYPYLDWELQSPVARAMPAHHRDN
ncbi:MAG: radical SAM protein [Acidimicrobiales bacterium]|nr:radical SAM protein [Acidimicrobiales bacterium]